MISASDKWQLVEEKLAELKDLVEENWNNGDWELALNGENIIKTVEQSQAHSAEMRRQTNQFMRK
ncbi:MAG: hypothetical protein V3R96_01090 [Dehalococcoidales bacterium]